MAFSFIYKRLFIVAHKFVVQFFNVFLFFGRITALVLEFSTIMFFFLIIQTSAFAAVSIVLGSFLRFLILSIFTCVNECRVKNASVNRVRIVFINFFNYPLKLMPFNTSDLLRNSRIQFT